MHKVTKYCEVIDIHQSRHSLKYKYTELIFKHSESLVKPLNPTLCFQSGSFFLGGGVVSMLVFFCFFMYSQSCLQQPVKEESKVTFGGRKLLNTGQFNY